MYPKNLNDITDGAIRARIAVERKIVKRTVTDLLAQGYELSVHDGEDWHARTTDANKLFAVLMETDEDRLFVHKMDGKTNRRDWFGWVFFVYGNDGYDVISDYTINLEDALKGVNAYADSLEIDG